MITGTSTISSTSASLTDVETTEIYQMNTLYHDCLPQCPENNERKGSGSTVAQTESIENNLSMSPIYKAFSPLIFSFKLMGLFHTRKTKTPDASLFSVPSASQIYALTVTMMPWLIAIRFLFTFRLLNEIGPKTISAFVLIFWLILCGCNAICLFQLSHHSNKFQKYIIGFNNLARYGGTFVCPKKAKRYIFTGVVIMWLAAAGNIAFLTYFTFDSDLYDTLITDPVSQSDTFGCLILKCIAVINMIYLSVLWIFPFILELSLCLLLYFEFAHYKRSFRSKVMPDGKLTGCLEIERRRFLEMVRIVRAADRCLSLHHGASFSCGIANFCLLLYSLIYYHSTMQNASIVIAYLFWIFTAIADISLVCLGGILVNSAVSIKQFVPKQSTNLFLYSYNSKARI